MVHLPVSPSATCTQRLEGGRRTFHQSFSIASLILHARPPVCLCLGSAKSVVMSHPSLFTQAARLHACCLKHFLQPLPQGTMPVSILLIFGQFPLCELIKFPGDIVIASFELDWITQTSTSKSINTWSILPFVDSDGLLLKSGSWNFWPLWSNWSSQILFL